MLKRLSTLILALAAAPAWAHHPLGGMPMETFSHGFMSGIGHPLLGFDHLFFVTLIGIAAALTMQRWRAPLAYIATMLAGCGLTSLWHTIPAAELMIAISLLTLGAMVLSGRTFETTTLLTVFAAFGLFHGSAFGAALAGQEAGFATPVLIGYLAGLGLTQYALAQAGAWATTNLWRGRTAAAIEPRLAGAMVAGAGLYLALEMIEGHALALLVG